MEHKLQAQFAKQIERLAYTRSIRDVFTDMLDITLRGFCVRDEANILPDLLTRLSDDDRAQYAQLIQTMGDIADNDGTGMFDALGDLFMEHLSFGKNGQFFTPQPICDAMAMMQPEPEDGQTVCDPACGSGRTLLAMAKRNRKLIFYGSDIDLTCVKMAAVNMLLNSLTAEIAWMNTLSLEHWASFHCRLDPFSRLPFLITTGANQTNFVRKLELPRQPDQSPPAPVTSLDTPEFMAKKLTQQTLF